MKIKLKPCPFCGSDKVNFEDVGVANEFEDWAIYCDNCGAFFHKSTDGEILSKREVATAWNKRYISATDDIKSQLPIPCTKVEEKTVKDGFQKINEELDELKEVVLEVEGRLEAADIITVITSMLEAMGIDEDMRQAAQKRVNWKNKELGRFEYEN